MASHCRHLLLQFFRTFPLKKTKIFSCAVQPLFEVVSRRKLKIDDRRFFVVVGMLTSVDICVGCMLRIAVLAVAEFLY